MEKYTLIITEKPDAAKRIAFALDLKGTPIKRKKNGVPYYLARRDKDIIVVPALGHLYTLVEEQRGRNFFPVYRYKWVPRNLVTRNSKQIQKWLETISKLAKDAITFIDACDYDVEGSIIGYHILKYVCNNKEMIAKRMKFSSLTKDELETSYSTMLPHLDFPLIEAGLTRHEVDWLYGVNLTRALTITAKNYSGKYTTISTGRVQGPTLGFLVSKEKAINRFVPKKFWELKAYINLNGLLEAKYEKKVVKTKSEATAVINKCVGKDGQVEKIDIKEFSKTPPTPFNLSALQNEVYTLFGYLPRYTLNIVQRLYLEALISYPRTDSQKLPPTINFKKILQNLNKAPEYRRYTMELLKLKKLSPHNGKKDDPAHPAIYPTGNVLEQPLTSSEKKVLDLIIRRFMAVFGKPTIKKSKRVNININKHHFHLNGIQTLDEGWQFFYKPYIRSVDTLLPPLEVGQKVKIFDVISNERFTKPPSRYNPSSLLKKMEEKAIGTKSTRTGIIQTLYNRKYIAYEKMVVTDLGLKVFEILKKYCPIVVSIKLTRALEEKMNKIRERNEKRETVLENVIEILDSFMYKFKQNEKKIGEKLSSAIKKSALENRLIGPCPVCITGKIIIQYSKKTGKRFIGCTNYFEKKCTTSFPLPQRGAVKPHNKKCHKCSWPTVQIETKRNRRWIICFNPDCSQNKKKRNT